MGDLAQEANARLTKLKQASQEYHQMVSLIEGKYDQKEADIRVLEQRIEKLKEQLKEMICGKHDEE